MKVERTISRWTFGAIAALVLGFLAVDAFAADFGTVTVTAKCTAGTRVIDVEAHVALDPNAAKPFNPQEVVGVIEEALSKTIGAETSCTYLSAE